MKWLRFTAGSLIIYSAMAMFRRVDSDVSVRSSTGSIPVPSTAANADTLPLPSASSTLLYEVDSLWGTDAPRRSSVSALCFDAGTGAGGHLEQTVRRELLTRPWFVTPQRSPSILLPPCRSAASPLITAGLDPVRAEDRQRAVSHSTAE